jgi:hypothetical protein
MYRHRQLFCRSHFVAFSVKNAAFHRYSADYGYVTLLIFMVDEFKNSKTLWRSTNVFTQMLFPSGVTTENFLEDAFLLELQLTV